MLKVEDEYKLFLTLLTLVLLLLALIYYLASFKSLAMGGSRGVKSSIIVGLFLFMSSKPNLFLIVSAFAIMTLGSLTSAATSRTAPLTAVYSANDNIKNNDALTTDSVISWLDEYGKIVHETHSEAKSNMKAYLYDSD